MGRQRSRYAAAILLLAVALLARWGVPCPSGPAAAAIPAACELLAGGSGTEQPSILLAREFESRTIRYDLDGDGIREEYTLQSGRLLVETAAGIIWQTPPDWQVAECLIGDATGDTVPDLLLSVWKTGSFGRHKPFWVSGEDDSYRNHLFIFKPADGGFKAVWQSSNLDRPNLAVFLSDRDGDGHNELIALESGYDDPKTTRVTIWRWNGWGFSRAE